jgi:hypothetical protein
MSDARPPFVLIAAMLAASLGLGPGVTLRTEISAGIDATADPEIKSSPSTEVAGDAAVPLGQPFALAVGETAVLEDGLDVRFAWLVGDSRCPADVVCVWEGNAEVAIEVAMAGKDRASLRLNTNPGFATEATYLAYTVELIGLEPYPRTDSPTDEPYRATLVAGRTRLPPTPGPTSLPSPEGLIDA